MSSNLQRRLSLIAGIATIPVAIGLVLFFLSNELRESEAAPQWGGHELRGFVVIWIIALVFSALAGFVPYYLIRFGIKPPRLK